MKITTFAIALSILLNWFQGEAEATMLSPSSIIYNSLGEYGSGLSQENLINHRGLVTNFTSGLTELSYYRTLDSSHISPSLVGQGGFASLNNDITSGYIDFDLGGWFNLATFLLWNDNDNQGINKFQLLIDNSPSFSTATSMGIFNAQYGPTDYSLSIPLQLFPLNEELGRYVRLVIYSTHREYNNLVNFGEIAFDTASPVPEPETGFLMISGIVFAVRCRFFRKAKFDINS